MSDPIADTVRNLMGLFDNAVERRRRINDTLYIEAIDLGRLALALLDERDAGITRTASDFPEGVEVRIIVPGWTYHDTGIVKGIHPKSGLIMVELDHDFAPQKSVIFNYKPEHLERV